MITTAIRKGKIVEPDKKLKYTPYKYDGRTLDKVIIYAEIETFQDCAEMIDFLNVLKASFYKIKDSRSL